MMSDLPKTRTRCSTCNKKPRSSKTKTVKKENKEEQDKVVDIIFCDKCEHAIYCSMSCKNSDLKHPNECDGIIKKYNKAVNKLLKTDKIKKEIEAKINAGILMNRDVVAPHCKKIMFEYYPDATWSINLIQNYETPDSLIEGFGPLPGLLDKIKEDNPDEIIVMFKKGEPFDIEQRTYITLPFDTNKVIKAFEEYGV